MSESQASASEALRSGTRVVTFGVAAVVLILALAAVVLFLTVNERLTLTRFQRLKLTHPMWRKAPRRAALT